MTTALAHQTGTPGLAPGTELFFTDAQEQMILKTFLGGATKEEAVVLLETVRRRRLDPFSRQVYFVKRWDNQQREEVWAIQTSIDGLRGIADRTGKYEGQTAPEWCGDDGQWRDVWLDAKPPAAARVGVYKTQFREPAYGIARLATYQQLKRDGSPTQFWQKMPDLMLAKCAEALALRKAFPEDTGGLYISEEMPENPPAAEVSTPVVTVVPEPQPAPQPAPKALPPPAYVAALWKRCHDAHGNDARAKLHAAAIAAMGEPYPPSREWTQGQAESVESILFSADVSF